MKPGDELPMTIRQQGPVIVNCAYIVRACSDIVLAEIDLRSKRAELLSTYSDSTGAIGLTLAADEHTLHVDTTKDRATFTEIDFPTLTGWRIFAASGPGRYTLSIAFVKDVL